MIELYNNVIDCYLSEYKRKKKHKWILLQY